MVKTGPWAAGLNSRYWCYRVVLGALVLLVGLMAFFSIQAAVDDAFIVYRYVDRFLAHKGLTFNDGEAVEGFTSLLWTLLLSLASALGFRPDVVSVVINFVVIMMCCGPLVVLLGIADAGDGWVLVSVLALACSLLFFKVVFLGLELGLYALLLMAFVCALLAGIGYPRGIKASRLGSVLAGILAAALFATRPESLFLLPLCLAFVYLFPELRLTGTLVWYLLVPFGCFVSAIVFWRFSTYGALLPNSVTAKSVSLSALLATGGGGRQFLRVIYDGVIYVGEAYITNPALLLCCILTWFSFLQKKNVFVLGLLWIPVLWQHVVILVNGGDWMPFHRFVNMYIPVFIAIFAVSMKAAWKMNRLLKWGIAVAFVGLSVFGSLKYLSVTDIGKYDRPIDKHHLYQAIGARLSEVWIEHDVLMAEAGGRIGYSAPDVYLHEPAGLVDKTLARDPSARRSVYGRSNPAYSLGLGPAVIVKHSWPRQELWQAPGLGYPERYRFYCVPPLAGSVSDQWVHVILRQDRAQRYGAALAELGIRQVAYQDIEKLRGEVGHCGFDH